MSQLQRRGFGVPINAEVVPKKRKLRLPHLKWWHWLLLVGIVLLGVGIYIIIKFWWLFLLGWLMFVLMATVGYSRTSGTRLTPHWDWHIPTVSKKGVDFITGFKTWKDD